MTTSGEEVLEALKSALVAATAGGGAVAGAGVERNSAVPEVIPDAGLIVLRDGDPGEPEVFLGFREAYYQHEIEIELYFADAVQAARDAGFDALAVGLGTVLEADLTLGGLVEALTYGAPSAATEPVEGGRDIKQGVVRLMVEYVAASPLG